MKLLIWLIAASLAVSPVLAYDSSNPPCLLQIHPEFDATQGVIESEEPVKLRPPIILPKKQNWFQRHPKLTKNGVRSFVINLMVSTANHMYVPINSRN